MIQYMLDTGLLPGTCHDISMVPAKLGVAGALQDIQNNHPNDLVSVMYYSRPDYNGEPTDAGEFAKPMVSLSRNYTQMINRSLHGIRPTAAPRMCVLGTTTERKRPRRMATIAATRPPVMASYVGLQTSSAGRRRCKGRMDGARYGQGAVAQKLVILETDGMANAATTAATTNAGAYKSFYNVGPSYTYSSSNGDPTADAVSVATRICALDSDTSGIPGFSTTSKPVLIHCIAFGAIFEPTASGSDSANATNLLQQVSTIGSTTFPSSSSDPTNGYKWCIGTLSQRQTKLQTAFTNIMDNTVSIVLVK